MVGTVRYALDIAHVREIVTPLTLTHLPHTPGGLAGVADHRSEVVPIINLRARFNLPAAMETARGRRTSGWSALASRIKAGP